MNQQESGEYVWNWILGITESGKNRKLSYIREYSLLIWEYSLLIKNLTVLKTPGNATKMKLSWILEAWSILSDAEMPELPLANNTRRNQKT